jgi:hypothetical protein
MFHHAATERENSDNEGVRGQGAVFRSQREKKYSKDKKSAEGPSIGKTDGAYLAAGKEMLMLRNFSPPV